MSLMNASPDLQSGALGFVGSSHFDGLPQTWSSETFEKESSLRDRRIEITRQDGEERRAMHLGLRLTPTWVKDRRIGSPFSPLVLQAISFFKRNAVFS
jgi:hypothetical protein